MSNIRLKHSADNGLSSMNMSKQQLSTKEQQVKKQAFTALHNVIAATSTVKANITPDVLSTSMFFCSSVLRSQQSKRNITNKRIQQLQRSSLTEYDEKEAENLFDYWDGNIENFHKSDQAMWSEQNLISDEQLNKVLSGGEPDSDMECYDECHSIQHMDYNSKLSNSLSLKSDLDTRWNHEESNISIMLEVEAPTIRHLNEL